MTALPEGFPRSEDEEGRVVAMLEMAGSDLMFGQRVRDGAVMVDSEHMEWSFCDPEDTTVVELLLGTGHLRESGMTVTVVLDGGHDHCTVRLITLTPAGWELRDALWSGTPIPGGAS